MRKRLKRLWFGPIYIGLGEGGWATREPLTIGPMVWTQDTWDQMRNYFNARGMSVQLHSDSAPVETLADIGAVPRFDRHNIRVVIDTGQEPPQAEEIVTYTMMLGGPDYIRMFCSSLYAPDPVALRNDLADIWEDTAKRRMPAHRMYRAASVIVAALLTGGFGFAAVKLATPTALLVPLMIVLVGFVTARVTYGWLRGKADELWRHTGRWASVDLEPVFDAANARARRDRWEKWGIFVLSVIVTAIFFLLREK